jgi:hypothetical protein
MNKKKIIPRRPRPFKLYVRVYLRNAIYFIWQKSCTFPYKNKHGPIPYKCMINQFNFIMIDGHIKILI